MRSKILTIAYLSLISLVLTPLLLPAPALALPLQMRMELTNSVEETLDPDSLEAQNLLWETGLELETDDPIWQDAKFNQFAELYFESIILEEQGDLVNAIYRGFDSIDIAIEIDHPEFNRLYFGDEGGLQIYQDLKETVYSNKDEFESDPETFLLEWTLALFAEILEESFKSFENELSSLISDNPDLYLYGYASPYQANPGQIVWLRAETQGMKNLTVTWEQTFGTEVVWLNTDSVTDRAFIAPDTGKSELLDFQYTITGNGITVSSPVYVDVVFEYNSAIEDEITELYTRILQREPDAEGYTYWNVQYKAGMSLQEIEQRFYKSDEYRKLR